MSSKKNGQSQADKPSKQKASVLKKPSKKPSVKKKPTILKKKVKEAEDKAVYFKNGFWHVKSKIVLDKDPIDSTKDTKHLPRYSSEKSVCAELVAKIPPTMVGGIAMPPKILLNHRASAKIRTGVKVALPHGFKLSVSALDHFAEKGLVVSNAPSQSGEENQEELHVYVLNAGRELVEIKDGDKIANVWVEPVYRFDWELVDKLD